MPRRSPTVLAFPKLPSYPKAAPKRGAKRRCLDYRNEVKLLVCCCCGEPPGRDGNHCHHRIGKGADKGVALKVSDRDTMPLCWKCHTHLHALSGPFKGWSGEQLRLWQLGKIAETRLAVQQARKRRVA